MIPFFKDVYDISVMLGNGAIDYPGDTPYSRERTCAVAEGAPYELSRLVMSAHAGTHIDFPAHFVANGRRQHECHVREFILPASVIEIDDPEVIRPDGFRHPDIQPGEAVLFKTENSRSGRSRNGVFSEGYVYLSKETAQWCVGRQAALIGTDYITIERYGDETFPAHQTILGNDIAVLEGIDLEAVGPGKYTLICLPLNLWEGEASPVRAILVR